MGFPMLISAPYIGVSKLDMVDFSQWNPIPKFGVVGSTGYPNGEKTFYHLMIEATASSKFGSNLHKIFNSARL